jgi:membrane-bound lytic murein transglycosylase D
VNSTFEEIKDLNPAILRWCTPPGVKNFTLNIPKNTKEIFKTEYAKIPDDQKFSYKRHKIRSGETISGIAKRYATSMSVIKKMNNLRSNRIRAGKYLIIPVAQNETYYKTFKPVVYKSSRKKSSSRRPVTNVKGHKKVTYLVKKGDTLGHIAELYNTRASKIRYWNGLAYGRHIYPNQRLNIWVPENNSEASNEVNNQENTNIASGNYYIVKEGDTLWDIALKHKMSLKKLKDMNNLRSNRIKPGEKLIIQN